MWLLGSPQNSGVEHVVLLHAVRCSAGFLHEWCCMHVCVMVVGTWFGVSASISSWGFVSGSNVFLLLLWDSCPVMGVDHQIILRGSYLLAIQSDSHSRFLCSFCFWIFKWFACWCRLLVILDC